MAIRTGLIGFGLAGTAFHAPLIEAVDGLELSAIASSRADAIRAAYPRARPVVEPAELIADPDIDLIVIASPNDTHAPLARAALEAGKHVVIDKPFATNPADGEMLAALAARTGKLLTAYHNRRWDSDFLTVRRLIASGRLGKLALYEARWDRFRPAIRDSWHEVPGEGGGLLADLGPHLIDQALVLFGAPQAVSADVLAQREGSAVDDYFEITLHYGAMRAILSSSSLVAAARPRFAVHGSGGSFVKYGLDPQETKLRAGEKPGPGLGAEPTAAWGMLMPDGGAAERVRSEEGDYRLFYEGVSAAIAIGAPAPVSPTDAVAGLRLIALARQSAAEGRLVFF